MPNHPITRRAALCGLASATLLAGCSTPEALSPEGRILQFGPEVSRDLPVDEGKDALPGEISAPREVTASPDLEAGQILVYPALMVLRYVYAPGRAREYPVGLGRAGLEFEGEAVIERKQEWPSWRPTDDMIARNPDHYGKFADGVPGGPANPLGARALYLYRDGRDTYYRIHGTDAPSTIGTRVSNGCIRMLNEHVVDLYLRVPLGTRVRVVS